MTDRNVRILMEIVNDILGYLDDWDDDPEPCDYTSQIRPLVLKIKPLLLNNEKLIEFVRLVKECPANSVHLMPLAADALLKQLHTDSVVSEDSDG